MRVVMVILVLALAAVMCEGLFEYEKARGLQEDKRQLAGLASEGMDTIQEQAEAMGEQARAIGVQADTIKAQAEINERAVRAYTERLEAEADMYKTAVYIAWFLAAMLAFLIFYILIERARVRKEERPWKQ